MKIKPLEYSDANNFDPYQHTIIKYVSRYREKNGLKDLHKAMNILNQLAIVRYGEPIIKEPKIEDHGFEEVTLLRILVTEIKGSGKKYKRIVSSGRGGAWAAANLGYALGIEQILILPNEEICKLTDGETLYVDDIVDTGKTITGMIIDSAVLYCRYGTQRFPTFSGKIVPHQEYIKLPLSQMFDPKSK